MVLVAGKKVQTGISFDLVDVKSRLTQKRTWLGCRVQRRSTATGTYKGRPEQSPTAE
jgi:hypothetical protein